VVGLVSGFLCFVVPGLLMLPRYRAWRRAERPTPGAAGPVGAVVVWAAVAGAIAAWTSFDVLAGLVFVLGLPPSLVVSARGSHVATPACRALPSLALAPIEC
jgi:hypothetical protein